jgi:hypothetical protein
MHWVLNFNAKNLKFANKSMVLFQLLPYVFQSAIIVKGGKTPIFWLMHWIFVLMQKIPKIKPKRKKT